MKIIQTTYWLKVEYASGAQPIDFEVTDAISLESRNCLGFDWSKNYLIFSFVTSDLRLKCLASIYSNPVKTIRKQIILMGVTIQICARLYDTMT